MRGRSRKGPNPLSRSYESNGPDVKIRGNALHIAEKYVTLARDAASSGDRVAEQNYLQHAEHYYRIVAAAQAQMPQSQPFQRADADGDDDNEMGDRDEASNDRQDNGGRQDDNNDRASFDAGRGRQPYGLSEPQPYANGRESNGHGEGDDADDDEGNDTESSGVTAEQSPPPRRRRAPRQRAPRSETPVAAEEAVSGAEE